MEIVLYVHDLFHEIGHSRAMLETLNHFPNNSIKKLDIICFTSDEKEKLFSGLGDKVTIHKLPFKNLKPFLLKAVFFHVASLIYTLIFVPKNKMKISIGVASLICDAVNVQFVHNQWSKLYFKHKRVGPIQWLYKKILLGYLDLAEKLVFYRENVQLFCLSEFVSKFCIDTLKISPSRVHTAYSSVNTDDFNPILDQKEIIKKALVAIHPELGQLDTTRPIALFVGAYQRKGLPIVLEKLTPNTQLVVVGKPDAIGEFKFPDHLKITPISFSKNLREIYSLCDCFIFPTAYEPFGLVILEAALMGLEVHVTRQYVGASELLENLPGIKLYETPDSFPVIEPRIISSSEREIYIAERKAALSMYTWKSAAEIYYSVLKS
jgi:glycosyltransferase involved in cell wall biosynthesis